VLSHTGIDFCPVREINECLARGFSLKYVIHQGPFLFFVFARLLTAAKYFETLKGQVEIKKITFYIYSGLEFNSIPLTNGL